MPLTKRQREILTYLTLYSEQHGYAPSFEEIAENFSYSSLATVHEHLSNLERKGFIKRSYTSHRSEHYYTTTLQGNALAKASAAPPLTRNAAERILCQFLERIRAVNSNEHY